MMTERGFPARNGKSRKFGLRDRERNRKYQGPRKSAAKAQASTALDSSGGRSEQCPELPFEPPDLLFAISLFEFIPPRGDAVLGPDARHQGVGVARDGD